MYMLWCVPHQPGLALRIQGNVADILSLPETVSFVMLCVETTHLYVTLLDMPRAVMEVRSMVDTAPGLEDWP